MIFIFNFTFCVLLDSYGYVMLKLHTYLILFIHQSNIVSLINLRQVFRLFSLVRGFVSDIILFFIFPQQEMRYQFFCPRICKMQKRNFTKCKKKCKKKKKKKKNAKKKKKKRKEKKSKIKSKMQNSNFTK